MDILVAKHPLILSSLKNEQTVESFDIHPLTESLRIVISRPTQSSDIVWDEASAISIRLGIELDGYILHCEGGATGGIRSVNGVDILSYSLEWKLPCGYFDPEVKLVKRIGEMKVGSFKAFAVFQLTKGNSISTDILIEGNNSEVDQIPFHNSVTFDSQTSIQEVFGDGIVSVNHTASGSNRVAIMGVATDAAFGTVAGTVTYGGSSATNIVTNDGNFADNAAYYFIAPPTSSQTVISDLTDTAPTSHTLGVVILNGVDQVTPVGTPQFFADTSAPSPASLDIGSIGTDDMVIDVLYLRLAAVTVGADQTERVIVTNGTNPDLFRMSTQPGSAGGVMSWTWTGTGHYAFIAVKVIAALTGVTNEQASYRFRNDDGSEVTATWKAAQATDILISPLESFRLRMVTDATGDPPAQKATLQYKKTTQPDWQDITLRP